MSTELTPFFNYLQNISSRGVRRGLNRMREAMALLSYPDRLYRNIHITGTNGKGSVCTFIARLLSASGYRVGLALSPHVDDFRERIQISDPLTGDLGLISADDLLATHNRLLAVLPDSLGLTYFEWSVLLAFVYFASKGVDFAVLETGLGGRWDATNVVEHSVLAGITTVGLDHQEYLGNTLPAILTEKVQVARSGADFLFGPQDPLLINQAKEHCHRIKARFHGIQDVCVDPPVVIPKQFLADTYIQQNLIFAFAASRLLSRQGIKIDTEAFFEKPLCLPPARMELICKNPRIIRDGAHNEQGLKALRSDLHGEYGEDYVLVFGVLRDRDFGELAKIIKPARDVYWARFDAGDRTTSPEIYEKVKKDLGGTVVELSPAFKAHLLKQHANRLIVVCGSFYLCAQFKKMWEL